jgi:hypothetical protein
MGDRGRHFDTGKKLSLVPKIDVARKHYQERNESQRRDEQRNPGKSFSKEIERPKASYSGPAREFAKLHISKKTEHQRPYGQRPTGTPFPQEISRATSSSFPRRDTRRQRKYDSQLRTQWKQLRGGGDLEETSEQQGEPSKSAQQKFDEAVSEADRVGAYKQSLNEYSYKKHQSWELYERNASNIASEVADKIDKARDDYLKSR